jgi:hypothetical protein
MANFTGFLALPPNKNRGLRFALQSFLPKWGKGMYCPVTVFKISMT